MTEGLVSYAWMFERMYLPPECQPNRRSKNGQIAVISGPVLEEAIYRSNFQFIFSVMAHSARGALTVFQADGSSSRSIHTSELAPL